jgi:hypothetical protein
MGKIEDPHKLHFFTPPYCLPIWLSGRIVV